MNTQPLALLLLLTSSALFAQDQAPVLNDSKTEKIQQAVEQIEFNILDLEVSYEIGADDFVISDQVESLENQLLYQEYQLGTPRDEDSRWSESEQMILNAKIKLEELQDKIKLEGDWGKIRFRVQDFGGEDPGAMKLRYNYGF